MNLKQLQTFVQIVAKGSFAAAAEGMHTTQSTVSARVKDLEHDLGVELFDRSAHRAQLTPKGRELFAMSQQIVAALEQLRARIADTSSVSGTLRLGAVGVVAGTWLPALVRELRTRHPALELQLDIALSKALTRKIRAAQLDVAIIVGRLDEPELQCESIGEERFAWMASPSLGAGGARLTPSDIAALPVIALPPESFHHAGIKAWFAAGGARYQPAITCSSMEVMARLVTMGQGVGMLPCDYYGSDVSLGALEILRTEPAMPGAEITLLSMAGRPSAYVAAVTDAVKVVRRHRLVDA
ncbi:MAG: LysR family transcriptional regulator [Gammaproteobacteria bacterium]|nr:LysR family transcriptional regulator [Gammaproteobacteria bacterium]MBU1442376.1 LysR family transcriptional regulator [Gammaproteobacteria bacterium]MBU2285219.1 LysR family transcriptional regulator [Gammaproteobacteria bacterium]MBU2411013.1 LysR family transcriptional regulator [Gammaproteobacteria bacterium]